MTLIVTSNLTSGMHAASNPIYLKLQRYDYEYDHVERGSVEQGFDGKVVLYKDGGGNVIDSFEAGQMIRVIGGVIDGTYEVLAVAEQLNVIFIDLEYDPSMDGDVGYISNPSYFELPYVQIEIYQGIKYIGTLYNAAKTSGEITIDFSRVV